MYQIQFCRMRKYFYCITKNCEYTAVMTVMASAHCQYSTVCFVSPALLPYFNFLPKVSWHPHCSFLLFFLIHLHFASHIHFPVYPLMHISVRINLLAKSWYWYFPLLRIKSHHSFLSHSFPCLYCVFHIHFGIEQWHSRCCMEILVLKPFSHDLAHLE